MLLIPQRGWRGMPAGIPAVDRQQPQLQLLSQPQLLLQLQPQPQLLSQPQLLLQLQPQPQLLPMPPHIKMSRRMIMIQKQPPLLFPQNML